MLFSGSEKKWTARGSWIWFIELENRGKYLSRTRKEYEWPLYFHNWRDLGPGTAVITEGATGSKLWTADTPNDDVFDFDEKVNRPVSAKPYCGERSSINF